MSETRTPKYHFVLVHGASHGGWCWYKIRCLMETSGYKVTCLDLESSGIDPCDPNTLFTFEAYNKPLIDFLISLPDDQKVILVGGLSLTDALHRFGNKKIHMAIYVAANMLKYGFATDQDSKDINMMQTVADLSEYGDKWELYFGLGPDQPPTSVILKKEFSQKILYNSCSMEDITLASMLLKPAPAMALGSAQFTEGSDVDKVPRVYIRTLYDRMIKQEIQDDMIKRWLPSQIFVAESDHSPFLSRPFVLFGFIIKAATSIPI